MVNYFVKSGHLSLLREDALLSSSKGYSKDSCKVQEMTGVWDAKQMKAHSVKVSGGVKSKGTLLLLPSAVS